MLPSHVVLDEADRMLDMGFSDDVGEKLISLHSLILSDFILKGVKEAASTKAQVLQISSILCHFCCQLFPCVFYFSLIIF